MAFNFQSKTWTISGEKEFENGMVLLNPSMTVNQVVISADNIFLSLILTENGGVFNHNFNIQYANSAGETNIDTVVDDAISQAFPSATVVV